VYFVCTLSLLEFIIGLLKPRDLIVELFDIGDCDVTALRFIIFPLLVVGRPLPRFRRDRVAIPPRIISRSIDAHPSVITATLNACLACGGSALRFAVSSHLPSVRSYIRAAAVGHTNV
jgi:hypothetical protein